MKSRVLLLLPLLLAGCHGNDPREDSDSAFTVQPTAPSTAPAPSGDPEAAAPRPPTPAEVDAADREYQRDFEHRMATRETYASCMRKLEGVEEPARSQIEVACKRAPGAPR